MSNNNSVVFIIISIITLHCAQRNLEESNTVFKQYHANGKLYISGELENEVQHGDWYLYNSLGNLLLHIKYIQGIRVAESIFDTSGYQLFEFPGKKDSFDIKTPVPRQLEKGKR